MNLAQATLEQPNNFSIPDLPSIVLKHKVNSYQQWPVRSNRASQLGHPCEKFLVYQRTAWEKAEIPSPEKLVIFQEGNVHEEAVLSDLRKAGLRIIQQQRGFEYKEHEITGSIDGKLILDGKAIPLEIKSCLPFVFDSINSVEDIKNHKNYYIRAYLAQMNLYLLLDGSETGILLFKNKNSGALKQITVNLDLDIAESLIQKADRINQHVKNGTLPERIEYEEDICGDCSFFLMCLPQEALKSSAELVDDPDFEEMLNRRKKLEPYKKEYEELDKAIKNKIKKAVEGDGKLVIGTDWLITVKTQERKGYFVPDTVFQKVDIKFLGGKTQ